MQLVVGNGQHFTTSMHSTDCVRGVSVTESQLAQDAPPPYFEADSVTGMSTDRQNIPWRHRPCEQHVAFW